MKCSECGWRMVCGYKVVCIAFFALFVGWYWGKYPMNNFLYGLGLGRALGFILGVVLGAYLKR
jgi:hypothetical protein